MLLRWGHILRYCPKYPLVTMEPCTVLLLNIDISAEQRSRRWWWCWRWALPGGFPLWQHNTGSGPQAVVPTLAVVPAFHTRHEAVPRQVQVHAHGPVHLPPRGPPHQHLRWTLPFRERHSACDICVSTPQCSVTALLKYIWLRPSKVLWIFVWQLLSIVLRSSGHWIFDFLFILQNVISLNIFILFQLHEI